ncbi:tetratricopeptide repeat protein [bacterium]|nr:tetratricopeptide repeat protein [bacterium]
MAKVTAERGGRLTKEDLKHDTLVETAVKVESFYETHKQTVWMAAGGLVAAIVAIMALVGWMGSSADEESFALMQAKTAYGQRQLADAQAKFQQVQANYGGETAAEAQYYLARIKFDKGDYSGALMDFEACLKSYSPDEATAQGAMAGVASALEATGRLDEAASKYMEVAGKYPESAYAPEALTQASRLYVKLNQNDKALEALDRIIRDYPESQGFQKAKTLADQLR